MKQRIVVTKEDIFLGRPGSGLHCPIALALKGTLQREVAVGPDRIVIETGRRPNLTLFLSKSLQEIIERFDKNEGMKPFEFYIELSADSSSGSVWEEAEEYAEAIC